MSSTSLSSGVPRSGAIAQSSGPAPQTSEPGPPDSPLEQIFTQIEQANAGGLSYLALVTTLSIPDICAGLECAPGNVWLTKAKYEAWCERLVVGYRNFTAQDCYRLRCGVVHQGNFGRPDNRYDRVIFTPPGAKIQMHDVFAKHSYSGEKVLLMSAEKFCNDMVAAARRWAVEKCEDPNVRVNMEDIIRLRPAGLYPYVIGAPVIA